MIKVEATGNSPLSYEVQVRGHVDYSEYEQILDNMKKVKRIIKELGKELGYEKEVRMNNKCDIYQPCNYRFAGMCMYPSNMGLKPCAEFSVGTCETNETLMQEANMRLNIHESDPYENAYEIDISICVREDIIDSTIHRLDSVIKMLTEFKEAIVRSK